MLMHALSLAATLAGLYPSVPAGSHQHPQPGAAATELTIVAPFGVFIPLQHSGLLRMIDVPEVAIEVFEPSANLAIGQLAPLSQHHELLDVKVHPSGALLGVTLYLPELARTLEGENPVTYFLVRPDGSFEFVPASDEEPGCRLIISVNPETGAVELRCALTDCAGRCELVVAIQPDGAAHFRCLCAEPLPE